VRPIATVGVALVVAALPVFLVGGLAVQIRRDLGFGEAALGAAVTGGFLASAAAAPLVGRLTDRIGARRSVAIGAGLATTALVGIGGFATTWMHVAVLLGVTGLGFAFTDPGLAILVTRWVPAGRHGLAFGIKEAAIPTATLVAGLAVPAIATTFGWRWAFALGAVPLAVLVWLMVAGAGIDDGGIPVGGDHGDGTSDDHRAGGDADPPPRRALVLIAASAATGSAAASGVGVFMTESGVAMGLGEAAAGLLLATGSVAGIVTRVGTGLYADRDRGPQLALVAGMLAVGAVTMAVGALGTTTALVVGTVGTFAAGWGWSGLLFLSLVRLTPHTPGAAAGVGLAGLGIGNALGPLAFGATAATTSFTTAWLAAATAAALGAGLMVAARAELSDWHAGSRRAGESST
jgi:MFS family permease